MKICVIGDGAWGTALAINAVNNNHQTVIWGAFPEYLQQMEKHGKTVSFFRVFVCRIRCCLTPALKLL